MFYFVGMNAADFYTYGSLQRSTGGRVPGYVKLGLENVNRSPSFIFDQRSDFHLHQPVQDYKKENTVHLFASINQPSLRLRLAGDYYVMTNYTYLTNFYQLEQFD